MTTSRLRLTQHVDGPQEVSLTVRPVRSQQTPSPSSLRLAAAFNGPGAPMALSFIEQLPTSNGLPLFWWLLTVCSRKVFSFQLWTLLLPRTLQMHSFPVCSQSMASPSMRPPTVDCSLLPLTRSFLRMRLYFTSGHHPSANGRVERVNSTWEQYLRTYCNYEQHNWSTLLLLAHGARARNKPELPHCDVVNQLRRSSPHHEKRITSACWRSHTPTRSVLALLATWTHSRTRTTTRVNA